MAKEVSRLATVRLVRGEDWLIPFEMDEAKLRDVGVLLYGEEYFVFDSATSKPGNLVYVKTQGMRV